MMTNQKIGFGKGELKTEVIGGVMLGYGQPEHKMKGSHTKTYSRVVVAWDLKQQPLVFICLEVAFITGLIYDTIDASIENQKIFSNYSKKSGQLIVLAQHTHTNIGGYSGEFIYNVPNGGRQDDIVQRIVQGTLEAIINARDDAHEQEIVWMDDVIEENEVSFAYNRSISAYSQNHELAGFTAESEKLDPRRAWDHRSHLWIMKNENKAVSGLCHFSPLHTNSMSNRYFYRHSDHKGLTAKMLEDKNIFALMGQGYCGDISPNSPFIIDAKLRLKSKQKNEDHSINLAQKQFSYIQQSLAKTNQVHPLDFTQAKFLGRSFDFSQIKVMKEFLALDAKTDTTSMPAFGTAFAVGSSLDGPSGFPGWLANPLGRIANWLLKKTYLKNESEYYRAHFPKNIFIHSHFKILIHPWLEKIFPLMALLDPTVAEFYKQKKDGSAQKLPWSPTNHFLQLWILAEAAYMTVPFELTTMAGLRLEKTLLQKLKLRMPQIQRAVILPYANNYAGYITTHEEYDVQLYEGGHTLYGRNSLAALQTIATTFAQEITL